jgi:phosphoglycolate phosphatase-like HAD superfamily hydrolase
VARAGAKVVLATSASPDELERLRATLGVEDSVAEITSSQDVERAKPEPDLVQVALQRAEVPPDRAVFVGDTVWDVQAAGRAGVPCIGVLTGGVSEAELTEAGAVAVYEDAATLLRDLEQSPLTRAATAVGSGGSSRVHRGGRPAPLRSAGTPAVRRRPHRRSRAGRRPS